MQKKQPQQKQFSSKAHLVSHFLYGDEADEFAKRWNEKAILIAAAHDTEATHLIDSSIMKISVWLLEKDDYVEDRTVSYGMCFFRSTTQQEQNDIGKKMIAKWKLKKDKQGYSITDENKKVTIYHAPSKANWITSFIEHIHAKRQPDDEEETKTE